MDLDTTRRKGVGERIFGKFRRGKVKILLGTQMVAQGFDFPEVDLVGVLLADIGLGLPDFRAEERTWQILTQVAGRVRRGGRVIVQTYSPNSTAISHLKDDDPIPFYREELKEREEFGYPPIRRLVIVEARGKDKESTLSYLEKLKERIEKEGGTFEISGPVSAPIEKVHGEFRFRLLFRTKGAYTIQDLLRKRMGKVPSGVRVKIDVDPLNLL
jgi:primosomal protein N' (replication factor Y)